MEIRPSFAFTSADPHICSRKQLVANVQNGKAEFNFMLDFIMKELLIGLWGMGYENKLIGAINNIHRPWKIAQPQN